MVGTDQELRSLRIAVTGASGFVGRALIDRLSAAGSSVLRLVRHAPRSPDEAAWVPDRPFEADPRLNGVDAVVHLAGAGIADVRWTARRKAVLRSSRVEATAHLASALRHLQTPPRVFVQASAVGFYGSQGDAWLTESSPPGPDYLGRLAADWEQAASTLDGSGTRRVCLRLGAALGDSGGVLAKLRPVFRWGLGGRLGTGRQWMSWIALPDLIDLIVFSITSARVRGPIIAAAPHPVTNRTFTRVLASHLHRPAVMPAPAWLRRVAVGELATGLLLASQRCRSEVLPDLGFEFSSPELETALRGLRAPPTAS